MFAAVVKFPVWVLNHFRITNRTTPYNAMFGRNYESKVAGFGETALFPYHYRSTAKVTNILSDSNTVYGLVEMMPITATSFYPRTNSISPEPSSAYRSRTDSTKLYSNSYWTSKALYILTRIPTHSKISTLRTLRIKQARSTPTRW